MPDTPTQTIIQLSSTNLQIVSIDDSGCLCLLQCLGKVSSLIRMIKLMMMLNVLLCQEALGLNSCYSAATVSLGKSEGQTRDEDRQMLNITRSKI